jgi:hypothetical protein
MKIILRDYCSVRTTEIDVDPAGLGITHTWGVPHGIYSELSGRLLGLFAICDELSLFVDGSVLDVENVTISLRRDGEDQVLTISTGHFAREIRYAAPYPLGSPYHSESDEDVDLGLRLLQILNCKDSRSVIASRFSN